MLNFTSLSARRAWIEIGRALRQLQSALVALRKESVDRNCSGGFCSAYGSASLSARRAWIEIATIRRAVWAYYVALRKESVDRNSIALASFRACIVALRKESVDRNAPAARRRKTTDVALRKESVDRNALPICLMLGIVCRSPQGERG